MNLRSKYIYPSLIVFVTLFSWGCSTTKEASEAEPVPPDMDVLEEELTELQLMLYNNRSKLSDVYLTQVQEIPDAFKKQETTDKALTTNPYDGFRVQILSTREVDKADKVANAFRAWADSTIEGYTAQAYVFFRQPFFKVHVGDFQDQSHANSFSRLIKNHYPEAWVVHDRIDPEKVPADTASFSFVKPENQ